MKQNNESASRVELNVLWTKAHPVVLAFIRSTIRDFHRGEDVMQEVAETVAEKFDQYDRKRPFPPWVLGIARNKVLAYLRKHANDRHVFDDETVGKIATVYGDVEGEFSEMQNALEICMKQVKGRAQKILKMRYVRNQTPAVIARALGLSANAVSVMLHRVRQALRECVQRQLDSSPIPLDTPQGGG
ncbi:MAG: sigma-70 family RNA polymerase sigma factor [Planctomycetes bacterium]|nr:sigma-70 family RNA polymerase sigma factor [Planctomycetota bacterium]